jgi:hypothetical protein
MAWHHHVLAAHHAVKHHARGFLMAAAHRHPLLAGGLVLIGAGAVVYEIAKPASSSNAPSGSGPLKPVV